MSHKSGVAIAAIDSTLEGIGIDLEYTEAKDRRLAKRVLTQREFATLKSTEYVSIFFSAKEAIYKALDELQQRETDFKDIEISYDFPLSSESFTLCSVQIHGEDWRGDVSVLVELPWIITLARRYSA